MLAGYRRAVLAVRSRPATWLAFGLLSCLASGSAEVRRLQTPPAVPATVRIPVGPLGFQAPNPTWQQYRVPTATLDFIDDTHLLFTFHQALLMHRLEQEPDEDEDQTIIALVLELPSGKVVERANWRLHDKNRYLWALGNGRFLERERNSLYILDKSLNERLAYLKTPGQVHGLELSPNGSRLLVEYEEKLAAKPVAQETASGQNALANSVPGSVAGQAAGAPTNPPVPTLGDVPRRPRHSMRMLVVDTHTNKLESVTQTIDPLPLTLVEDGYLTVQQDKGHQWKALLTPFNAPPRPIVTLTSNCQPELHSLNPRVFLAQLCIPYTSDHLMQAYDLDGKKLWEQQWEARYVWGNYLSADDGSRFAYESLQLDHAVTTLDPIDDKAVQGQVIGVYDVADGTLRMVSGAQPTMSAGQNYALSADGLRFAVLRAGSIEVYNLPPADTRGAR